MKLVDLVLSALRWLSGLDAKDAAAVKAAKDKAREVEKRAHPEGRK